MVFLQMIIIFNYTVKINFKKNEKEKVDNESWKPFQKQRINACHPVN
jgi:hypothetical protein